MKKQNIDQKANAFARKHGYGRADEIVFGDKWAIIDHIEYGYRKKSNDQYVPNAYRRNFGWKNTYYQHAWTIVMVPESLMEEIEK